MNAPFNGEIFRVRRSELMGAPFKGNWVLAPEENVRDLVMYMVLASTYKTHPRVSHPNFGKERRWAFTLETAKVIEVTDDVWGDRPPQPFEPRSLRLATWDKRYQFPQPFFRGDHKPHWRDAPTSLIVDFVRTVTFSMLPEIEPFPDITWESHRARAYQMPVEVFDNEGLWHEVWESRNSLYRSSAERLSKMLERRSKLPHNVRN